MFLVRIFLLGTFSDVENGVNGADGYKARQGKEKANERERQEKRESERRELIKWKGRWE